MLAGTRSRGTPTNSASVTISATKRSLSGAVSGVPNSAAATIPELTNVACTQSSSAGSPAA